MSRAPKCDLVLPDFEILKRQPKVPHVARTIAKRVIPNQHGTPVTYTVRAARTGRGWWIDATINGMRHSNTLHTTTPSKAKAWIAAVEAGRVCLKKPDPISDEEFLRRVQEIKSRRG